LAADVRQLSASLRRFFDFTGKVVLYVGAGGRQLLGPGFGARKVIAIDRDVEALRELEADSMAGIAGMAGGMPGAVEVVCADFADVALLGDVVYFEFCLHEMADPRHALAHAATLAPDVVVLDHAPNSDWAFLAAEEEQVRRSAEAIQGFGVRCCERFRADQRFKDYAELLAKIAGQGTVAVHRAQRFAGATDIVIPMSCELALL
jgi:hypothetical protein